MQKKRKYFVQPKSLILIFLAVAALMISSALFERYNSREEMYELMEDQAASLLETLVIASHNSLATSNELERQFRSRLLNNAAFIKYLYERNSLTEKRLAEIAEENGLYRVNIFDGKGNKVLASHPEELHEHTAGPAPQELLRPLFTGQQDTLIIGIRPARDGSGRRFAVALRAKENHAIAVNVDAAELLSFRRETGFGVLLRNIVESRGIVYAALQSPSGILAASGNVETLDAIPSSPFLTQALADTVAAWHEIPFGQTDVFEAVQPFLFHGETIGLFRLGLSLEPLREINNRAIRRVVIITLLLVVFASVILLLIFANQNFATLQKRFSAMEEYAGKIISNVSDAIVVAGGAGTIRTLNEAAEQLFKVKSESMSGMQLTGLPGGKELEQLTDGGLQQIELELHGQKRYLLASVNRFTDAEQKENRVIVLRDTTELHALEQQIQRRERLAAMGELASGVAHEIRNPLNSIGTIVQQLDKDFEPGENAEEYHKLARLVYREVKRMNETIQDFLTFTRPQPLAPEPIELGALLGEVVTQYGSMASEKDVTLAVDPVGALQVQWDLNQMRQALMNLVQNAIQATDSGGKILLQANKTGPEAIELTVSDTGCGIEKETLSKIFNLYFTTRAEGTGVGLSLVQRIIYDHGGAITVDSMPDEGTRFTLHMPVTTKADTTKRRT